MSAKNLYNHVADRAKQVLNENKEKIFSGAQDQVGFFNKAPESIKETVDIETKHKIILIGHTETNKIGILNSIQSKSGIGIDFDVARKKSKIYGKDRDYQVNTDLTVWDTAGQERFSTITKAYYRGANTIMLVVDSNNEETVKKARSYMIDIKKHKSCEADVILLFNETKEIDPVKIDKISKLFDMNVKVLTSSNLESDVSELFQNIADEKATSVVKNYKELSVSQPQF